MPSLLFTQLGVWNDALYKIGAQRLNSLTDASNPAAQYLADIWPLALSECMEEHPWSFACADIPMIPLNPPAWVTGTLYNVGMYVLQGGSIYVCAIQHTSGTFATDLTAGDWMIQAGVSPLLLPLPLMNDGCNNPYFMPVDFINPYLFSARAFYRKQVVRPPYIATAQIVLQTNNNNIASMKYIFYQTDVTQWSAKFCNMVSTKLASKLCTKITEANQYAVGLLKQYDIDLFSAIGSDSNTTSPDEAIADGWFLARLSGSTGAVGLGPDNGNVGWGIPGVG